MALQLSTSVRNARLNAIFATIGASAKLMLYTGAPPANCAAAAIGTLLGTLTLPATEENAAANGQSTIASAWSGTISYAGGGTIGYLRIMDSAQATTHLQCSVSYNAPAWQASTAVVAGQKVSNGGAVYNCTAGGNTASTGGPTGTASSITDGTATWAYVGAVGDMLIDNPVVASNQTININTFTLLEANG